MGFFDQPEVWIIPLAASVERQAVVGHAVSPTFRYCGPVLQGTALFLPVSDSGDLLEEGFSQVVWKV